MIGLKCIEAVLAERETSRSMIETPARENLPSYGRIVIRKL
jgi:hypothetical protein